MQDRFKFRIWDKENNKYIDFKDWKRFDVEFNFNPDTNEIWCEFDHNRYAVEQSTGLKDKNRKLIYEGDILGGVLESTYVHWCKDCKGFQLKNCIENCMCCDGDIFWYEVFEDDGKLEVIGNIHENPDLLED